MRSIFRGQLTRLLQLDLQRVAVHAAVIAIEHVSHVRVENLLDGLTRDDPERERLVATSVQLARVRLGESEVRRLERASVLERRTLPLLPKNFPDHLCPPDGTPAGPSPAPLAPDATGEQGKVMLRRRAPRAVPRPSPR